jgi:hypothetical protein
MDVVRCVQHWCKENYFGWKDALFCMFCAVLFVTSIFICVRFHQTHVTIPVGALVPCVC